MTAPSIVWLRRDLRLADQPAFHAAAAQGQVIPVYVLDDETPGTRAMGGASRWWLHHALDQLGRDLAAAGSRLILRRGRAVEVLAALAAETGAAGVHAIRHYEPWWRRAQGELGKALALTLHDGNYLMPPGSVLTGSGQPYKIYTPFKQALLAALPDVSPLPEPVLAAPLQWPASDRLEDWQLRPTRPDWAGGMRAEWAGQFGTNGALARFAGFLGRIGRYDVDRNLPSLDGSARLSGQLHFGEVSPRQLWQACAHDRSDGARVWRAELVWRDYAQNVICQFPRYGEESHRPGYDAGLWRDPARDPAAAADLAAWQQGRTGYPIVDAGMRQLWQTGWMHNRVRMIAASVLIKHLLLDWRLGERWFWDTLVDADYAQNAVNWQWSAGSGVDANMFVRIMAPLSQSEKFNAGAYIRRFVPELAALPDAEIHDPPPLRRGNYPAPIVGHREGRERALAAHRAVKG